MTDAQYKAVTAKIKALADVRKIAIDDTDSIIRAFHFNVHNDEERPYLESLIAEEKKKFVQAEAGLVAEPEKRGLNAAVDAEAEVPIAKKTRTESVPQRAKLPVVVDFFCVLFSDLGSSICIVRDTEKFTSLLMPHTIN